MSESSEQSRELMRRVTSQIWDEGRLNLVDELIAEDLVVGTADWYSRNNELSAVISRTRAASRPTERWLDDRADCEDRLRPNDCLQEVTEDALARVLPARERIANVRVLPWHSAVRRAKERTLDNYDAAVQAMKDYIGHSEVRSRISWAEWRGAYDSAARAAQDAVPRFPLFNLNARVEETWGG